MIVERRDCRACDGRGEQFEAGWLVDCHICGGFGVTNAVEMGWIEPEEAVWSCSHCGPHPQSHSNWCAKGCGRDYNEMFRVKIINLQGRVAVRPVE